MGGLAEFVGWSGGSSVGEKPGLTMVGWVPKGATSGWSDFIQPSRPNFDAAEGDTKTKPAARPAEDEIEMMCPACCLRITGSTARVTFIGPMRLTDNWRSNCSGVSSSK